MQTRNEYHPVMTVPTLGSSTLLPRVFIYHITSNILFLCRRYRNIIHMTKNETDCRISRSGSLCSAHGPDMACASLATFLGIQSRYFPHFVLLNPAFSLWYPHNGGEKNKLPT